MDWLISYFPFKSLKNKRVDKQLARTRNDSKIIWNFLPCLNLLTGVCSGFYAVVDLLFSFDGQQRQERHMLRSWDSIM